MGNLRLNIGGVVGNKQIDDAKAQRLADLIYNYAVLPYWPVDKPLPQTPAEKLDAIVAWLVGDFVHQAKTYRQRELAQQHADADSADLAGLTV